MPVLDEYGYGAFTTRKFEDLDYFFRVYGKIVKGAQDNEKARGYSNDFHYIDMNAGPGILPELRHDKTDEVLVPEGTFGSPFIFLKYAELYGLNYLADFIERHPKWGELLLKNLETNPIEDNPTSRGCGRRWVNDHNEILPQLINSYRKYKLGLIYHDPNNGDISFDILQRCARLRPRYDILINFPASLFKRQREQWELEVKLSDYLSQIPKDKKFIKDLYVDDTGNRDIHQWTFIFLTNYMKMNDIKKIGLIEIEKPEGAQIFERVNLSDKQRKKKEDELQMRLIELTPST